MKIWSVAFLLAVLALGTGQPRWVRLADPARRNFVRVSFIDSVQGWVAGDSGAICMTTNGGQSWQTQATGVTNGLVDLFMLNRLYGWAVGIQFPQDTSWRGTVFLRTTNGGTTWTRQDIPNEYFYTIAFFDSVNGWMAGFTGRIRKTTDGGTTWVTAAVESSSVSSFPIKHLDFYSPWYGYAVGGAIDAAGIMWRTTNGGALWSAYEPDHVGEPLLATYFIDSSNVIAVGGDFDLGSGIVRSKDGGRTWQYTYLGIWGEARAIAFRTPGEGYVPLGFPGTYMVTKDTGRTWHDFPTPDTGAVFDVSFPDSMHGYMVGAGGTVLKYDATPVTVNPPPADLPMATTLFQNFPNPFNPATRISYHLAEAVSVTVKVYNVLGREIATLFKGRQGPGLHEVDFNGEGLASGVYYYELTTTSASDRSTEVRKMLLVK